MSNKTLPVKINPEKICRQAGSGSQRFEGTLHLEDIPQLAKELSEQKSVPVELVLDFFQDDDGLCVVKGDIKTTVLLTCQRCMQPLSFALHTTFCVSPVHTDEAAKQLPERYEPLMVMEGEINVPTWIAEELHLALPLAPRHEPACKSDLDNYKASEAQAGAKSPFAALKGKVSKQKKMN